MTLDFISVIHNRASKNSFIVDMNPWHILKENLCEKGKKELRHEYRVSTNAETF